jgi:hypothetical protein
MVGLSEGAIVAATESVKTYLYRKLRLIEQKIYK